MPKLYLITLPIDELSIGHIPPITNEVLCHLDLFVVERLRTARRFIKKLIPDFNIDNAEFIELDKRNAENNPGLIEDYLKSNKDFGLMSESGTPCIADPGYRVVDFARRKGYKIIPLSGPSSIILSLMASGLNGQEFTFHGYLPIKTNELRIRLQKIGMDIINTGYTQIFIETPYRNEAMYRSIVEFMPNEMRLCVAQDVTSSEESIETMKIVEWRKRKVAFEKYPTIFLVGK